MTTILKQPGFCASERPVPRRDVLEVDAVDGVSQLAETEFEGRPKNGGAVIADILDVREARDGQRWLFDGRIVAVVQRRKALSAELLLGRDGA